MIKKVINSFRSALSGLATVWREEQNFRIEICATIVVLCVAFYFQFSFVEFISCIIAIVMVLTAEILNTAIEDVCNKIEPRHDPIIGKIKDIVSASVLITVVGAVGIAFSVWYHHFIL